MMTISKLKSKNISVFHLFFICDVGITSLSRLQVVHAALNNRFDSKWSKPGVNNKRR